MCGRYWIKDEGDDMQAIIDALNRRQVQVKTGEIFPGDAAPVIANNRRLSPAPFAMRWGFALDGSRRVINARSETAHQKSLFADGMLCRRCLIPASGYFEWARQGREKTKYALSEKDSQTLFMAGVYRVSGGEAEFAILTRESAPSIGFIHNRMPVILPRELLGPWLSPEADAQEILRRAVTDIDFTPAPGQGQTMSFLHGV